MTDPLLLLALLALSLVACAQSIALWRLGQRHRLARRTLTRVAGERDEARFQLAMTEGRDD